MAMLQRRSFRSSQRSRHSQIASGEDAFSYALRTAYLHYLLLPRPRRQIPAPAPASAHVNRMSTINVQDLVADFSRGLTHRDAAKSVRLPKDFLPYLRKRIEGVVMGRDSQVEYRDQSVKRTFGSFYSAFVEPRYYETTAKSRRPEDLLLIFYTHATKELQTLRPDDWKTLVDRHVALFVRLMSIIIKEHGWTSSNPELTVRLATLEKKLLRHDDNLTEDGGSNRGSSPSMVLGPPEPPSTDVNDMPMVKTVARVFNVPLDNCQREITKNRSAWTEKAVFNDLITYTNNLNTGAGGTLRSNDFDLDEAFEQWCKAEKAEVSDLILVMGRSHQELLQSSARARMGHAHSVSSLDGYRTPADMHRASMYESPSSMFNPITGEPSTSVGEDSDNSPYTYIPPDPRAFYRTVVSRCLTSDLNDPDTEFEPIDIPGADPVRLLSKSSLDLLAQCALRWRLPKFSRMVLFLDALRTKYQEGEVGLSMLDNAFMYFDKEVSKLWTEWTIADQTLYRQLLAGAHDFVLRELYDIMQHAFKTKAIPTGQVMWVLDQHFYNNELFTLGSMDNYMESLKLLLVKQAKEAIKKIVEEEVLEKTQAELLDPLHIINAAQKLIKLGERIQKRYKQPILGSLEPMPIFVETAFPMFALEAEKLVEEIFRVHQAEGKEMAIDDGFELYKELSEVRRIYLAVNSKGKFPVSLEDLFLDFPIRWLQTVDSKVIGWVEAAVKEDSHIYKIPEGEELGDERHTSSVVDIFRSFNQSIDTIKKLEWQNDLQYAKFMTAMAKVLGKGIMRYCEELECQFTFEMGKKTPEEEAALTQTTQQRWVSIAREAWSNKDKVEPYQFAPESCLKLNNIEFAIQQFDNLEHAVDSERLAEIVTRKEPRQREQKKAYVFTIKIMEAEDLKAMDIGGGSDPYVIIGDEYQKRLAKTRIVYNNLNPRWEESFDITTVGPILLVATLWDWDTVGNHDCLGRCSLKLDPSGFMDYLPKEYWLDLDTQGRLLLRISMEGERDDIQFHFGKAFRTLKRTEKDMTRQITDKLSAYIHHCLSPSALKNVMSKGYSISAVSNLFSRAGFNARPASVQPQPISAADIAAVLTPLTDYFNENFAILNQTLTPSAMTLVMMKLWKEVLVTLEALLVPTLSDKPSQQRQLTQQETEVVFRWLQLMLEFFNAVDEMTGEVTGVPIKLLKSPKYHDLQTLGYFYFEPTNDLIRNSERIGNAAAAKQQAMRQKLMGQPSSLASSGSLTASHGIARSKSVLNKRNLGTMRKAKEDKWKEAQAEPNDDMILRILRMRPEAAVYLRDRAKQKERLESSAAIDAIVAKSVQQGPGRMGRIDSGRVDSFGPGRR